MKCFIFRRYQCTEGDGEGSQEGEEVRVALIYPVTAIGLPTIL